MTDSSNHNRPQNLGPPKRRSGRWLPLFLFIIALVAAGAYLYVQDQLQPAAPTVIESFDFEVMPGWDAGTIALELKNQGFIQNADAFVLWLRYQELDRNLGEGLYELSPSMSATEIAKALAAGGRPRTSRVVIPEGFRAVEIAQTLADAGFGDSDSFMTIIQNPAELKPGYIPAGNSLEGYLFPASYDFPLRSNPSEVLELMLKRFEQEIDANIANALGENKLSLHQWVTLASMVQAEAANDAEMPIIAGVFLNRLDENMLLQSDPTVAYGLGKRLSELDRSAGDFSAEADHPWNTYTRPGLPQGPIGSPGRAALRAVLQAQRYNDDGAKYLYFLHGRNGEFRPNLTLQAHLRDVQLYLR